jgi:hypothetical protein
MEYLADPSCREYAVVAYSDLVAANYSSKVAAGSSQDLLTPLFMRLSPQTTSWNLLLLSGSGDKV